MTRKRTLFIMLLLTFIFGLISIDSKVYAEEVPMTETKVTEIREVKAEKEVIATVNEKLPTVSTKDSPAESEHSSSEEASEAEALTTKKPELEAVDDSQSDRPSTNQDTQEEKGQESTYQTSEKAEKAQATDEVDEAEKADELPLLNEENQEEDSDEEGVLAEVQDQIDPSEEGKDSETVQVTEPVDPEAEEENTEATEADEKEDAEAGEVLKEGETLEVAELAKEPLALGAGSGESREPVRVSDFEALKAAIEAAGNKPTTILIMKSFTLTETLKIGKGQNITISSQNNDKASKDPAEITRANDFNDYLFEVNSGEATLENIIIDGNSKNNKTTEKSLVKVEKGTLNIKDGAVLRNNKIKPDESLNPTHGGAINARNHATINMSGGSVEDNQATYGGGIQLYESTMNFTGGTVQKNHSDLVDDKPYNQYYSAGGGIIVREGSVLNMSSDAKVLNNKAAEIGGGISVGSNNPEEGSVLNMNGGIVDGNIAGSSGGGIFIQAKYFTGGPGKAYINAGKITNNKMDGSGKTNMAFGGGGIYVNGATEEYGQNGELYIENVLITENESEWEGAGLASCPISKTTIHVNNGVAFDQNQAGKPGNDVFIYSNENYGIHSGNAIYKLSKRMLGGGLFNWTKPDGSVLPDGEHAGTLTIPKGEKDAKFAANSNPEDIELANALAKVIISGNYSATRGGGIGSNGTIVIGTEGGTTEVEVEKQWKDNDKANKKRPNSIKVKLLAKVGDEKYLVETKEVKADKEWKAKFENLPEKSGDREIEYTVEEVEIKGYESKVTGDQKTGFIITNEEKPEEEPKTRDIKVTKRWDLVGSEKPVDKIDVELYRNGESTGKKLELNAGNNWSGEFKGLEIADKNTPTVEYRYSIKEVGENGGFIQFGNKEFEVTYSGDMNNGFVITNKEKPEEEPKTRDIKVTKRWDLVGSEKPVDKIDVELYRNGESTGKKLELNAGNNWSGEFKGLEIADKNTPTVEYRYSIKEVGENGGFIQFGNKEFEVTYSGDMNNGFVITNKEKPEEPPETPPSPKTRDIKVTKRWELADGERPVDRILVELYRDGLATGKRLELNADNNWTGEFTGLEIARKENPLREYVYSIFEVGENGGLIQFGDKKFEVTYSGDMNNGFMITNKEKPETPPETPEEPPETPEEPPETPPSPKTRDIKVTKRWDLATGERPVDRILVELYRDGQATGKRLELNADNHWTGEFTGLEIASKENPLREYIYSIFEVGENGGLIQFGDKKFEVTYSGDMNNGFMITNKEKPETPPETPEEPPETPEEPPETPEVPPETPGQPPRLPGKPPTGSPKTYDPGIGLYLMSSGMSVLGLYAVNKKKEN